MTDLNGYRTDMYVYTDYGAAAHHKVPCGRSAAFGCVAAPLFDGEDSRISSVAADTPGPGKTTITIGGTTGLSTDLLNGCELVISRPTSSGDRYITARVDDTTSTTIVVTDAGSTSAPVYLALNGQTQGFVVYDFHTGDNTTGGNWTDDPDYVPFLLVTGFTDENADFQSYMVGWTIIADVEKPSFLTIFAVPSGTRVEVFGDATGLSADGKTYRLVAPPGVDPTTGALSKPNTVLSKRANNRGCMWLWSGYQYVSPQVGHESGGSTTGAQGGTNKLGTYYCWNRTYDVFMGRWTTPDPAASPWGNLWDYSSSNPARQTDPNGMKSKGPEVKGGYELRYTGAFNGRCPEEVSVSVQVSAWVQFKVPFAVYGWPMSISVTGAATLTGSIQVCTKPEAAKIGILSGTLSLSIAWNVLDVAVALGPGIKGSLTAGGKASITFNSITYDPCSGYITMGSHDVAGSFTLYAQASAEVGYWKYTKELSVKWATADLFDNAGNGNGDRQIYIGTIPGLCNNYKCCCDGGTPHDGGGAGV